MSEKKIKTIGGTQGVEEGSLPPPTIPDNHLQDVAAAGRPEVAPKAPPVRKTWSSPIQAMARIEQDMNNLTPKQQRIVGTWFLATYLIEETALPDVLPGFEKEK